MSKEELEILEIIIPYLQILWWCAVVTATIFCVALIKYIIEG